MNDVLVVLTKNGNVLFSDGIKVMPEESQILHYICRTIRERRRMELLERKMELLEDEEVYREYHKLKEKTGHDRASSL